MIRGGGFSPNIFLHYSAADIAKQIALMKNMGVNTIRLEGHIMPPDFFEQMDQAGILVNAGYQCCDAWELQSSGLTTSADFQIMQNSALTIGQNLRNHPSVFSFQWSDLAAHHPAGIGDAERPQPGGLHRPGHLLRRIPAAARSSGRPGEKEGPYDWVPPNYWYDTTHSTRTTPRRPTPAAPGAMTARKAPGDTVPTLDSLNRFMSSSRPVEPVAEPDAQPVPRSTTSRRCKTGYAFGTMCHFDTALSSRYGSWSSLGQYVEEAQAQDYENTRAQFEAFIDHANNTPLPSTGTIYWQMNKGWPSLLWNLYNSDGDQAGSYFGAQEANRPLHALYALDNGTVTLDNLGRQSQSGLSVESKVYSLAGAVLDDQTASNITLASQQVLNKVLTPKVPAGSPVQVYFVELQLKQNGTLIDRNVYWLSTQPDAVNWSKTLGQPQGVISTYANLTSLQTLPQSSVTATAATVSQPGPDGADRATTVTITNTSASAAAFLLRADVRRGTASGQELPGDNELQSSIWQSNDITLFPGESQKLTVTWNSADLQGATPVVSVSGWNVPKVDIRRAVK